MKESGIYELKAAQSSASSAPRDSNTDIFTKGVEDILKKQRSTTDKIVVIQQHIHIWKAMMLKVAEEDDNNNAHSSSSSPSPHHRRGLFSFSPSSIVTPKSNVVHVEMFSPSSLHADANESHLEHL